MKKSLLLVATMLALVVSCGEEAAQTQKENTAQAQKEVTYEKVTAKELIDTLQNNALKAKESYKDKYVEITGRLNVIDANGAYITINPIGDDFVLTGIQAYIKNDEQKKVVAELSKGDKITVKGKIKDVGEVLGYSVDIDEISKTTK